MNQVDNSSQEKSGERARDIWDASMVISSPLDLAALSL